MKSGKNTGLALGVIILLGIAGQYLIWRKDILVGDRAPDFSYENLLGERHHLSDFKDEYVILSFWGSWCAPCRASNRKLHHFFKEEKTLPVRIISYGVEEDKNAWEMAMIRDSLVWNEQFTDLGMFESKVPQLYNVTLAPTYFLVSPTQKILGISGEIDQIIDLFRDLESRQLTK